MGVKIIVDLPVSEYEYLAKLALKGDEQMGHYERTLIGGKPLSMVFEKIRTDIAEHSYPVRYDHNSIEKGMTLTGIMQVLMDNEIKELNNADSN